MFSEVGEAPGGTPPLRSMSDRGGEEDQREPPGLVVITRHFRETEAVAVEALGRFDIADAHHRVQEFDAHEWVSRRVRITCFRFGGVRV